MGKSYFLQNKPNPTQPRHPDSKALPHSTHIHASMHVTDYNRNSEGFAQEKASGEAVTLVSNSLELGKNVA